VDMVYEELPRIVAQLENKELQRFANLRDRVIEVVNGLLQKHRVPTRVMIDNLIQMELAFINTNHPDFIGGDGAINQILDKMVAAKQEQATTQSTAMPNTNPFIAATAPTAQNGNQKYTNTNSKPTVPPKQNSRPQALQPENGTPPSGGFLSALWGGNKQDNSYYQQQQQQQQQQIIQATHDHRAPEPVKSNRLPQIPASIKAAPEVSDKEKFETELIKNLLCSYFNIVRKNVKDLVPKSIMYLMVNASKDKVHNELVGALYKEELFDELLEENASISARRKSCKAMIEILRKAHDIINEVRDFNSGK